MQPERARLKIEDFHRERIALLRQPAQGERFLFHRSRRSGEVMTGVAVERFLEQIRKPGKRRVHLDAPPRPTAAARVRFGVEQVQGRRHVGRFHAGDRVSVQRQSASIDVGTPEPGTGREHHHRCFDIPACALRFGNPAHVAVVADDQRDVAPCRARERTLVALMHVEAGKRRR